MHGKIDFKRILVGALGILAILVFLKFFGINPLSLEDWRNWGQETGSNIEEGLDNTGNTADNIINGGSSSGGGSSSSSNSSQDDTSDNSSSDNNSPNSEVQQYSSELKALTIQEPQSVAYDRSEWRHWDGYVSSCWNIREEVLYRQNTGDIVLLNSNKDVTSDKNKACYVDSGKWYDPYTGKTFTNPSDLDIDHMIPLGYAARQGGQSWSEEKKSEYANSLNPDHLIAVSASANRSKSDQGPAEWQPTENYQCQYAKNWINISSTWELTVPQADYSALEYMLSTC